MKSFEKYYLENQLAKRKCKWWQIIKYIKLVRALKKESRRRVKNGTLKI